MAIYLGQNFAALYNWEPIKIAVTSSECKENLANHIFHQNEQLAFLESLRHPWSY